MSDDQTTRPEETDNGPREDMFLIRRQKAEKIAQSGKSPYGHAITGLQDCTGVKTTFAALPEGGVLNAHVAGRLTAKRVMGKSLFANIKDQDGFMQLYVQKNVVGDESY